MGRENFARVNLRRLADDGWVSPSAVLVQVLRAAPVVTVQQLDLFICDSHSRSRMQLLSAQQSSLQGNGHDDGPMTWKNPTHLRRDP